MFCDQHESQGGRSKAESACPQPGVLLRSVLPRAVDSGLKARGAALGTEQLGLKGSGQDLDPGEGPRRGRWEAP